MQKYNSRSAVIILLIVTLSFFYCSSGGYQDWYSDEGQEDDLLGGLFSAGEYDSEEAGQPVTSGRWDNWYSENQSNSSYRETPQTSQAASSQQSLLKNKNTKSAVPAKYNPEFKITVIREDKITKGNQIRLLLKSNIRIPEIEDMNWKTLKNSTIGQIDGDIVLLNENQVSLRDDGLAELVISPSNPDEYFSFVSLADAGINAPGFAAPFHALDLKTITLNFTAATNHSYTYQYSFQTFNIKSVAASFAEKIIAPFITDVQLNILDSETHFPISGAVVTLTGTPPSPMKMLSSHISDTELLLHAVKAAPHYANSSSKYKTGSNGVQIPCFSGQTYNLHIMHPQYFYLTKDVEINTETKVFTYFLSRRSENVRILEGHTATAGASLK